MLPRLGITMHDCLSVDKSATLNSRGVFATSFIRCNTPLISLPKHACLNHTTSTQLPASTHPYLHDGSGIEYALAVLSEMLALDASIWNEYLSNDDTSSYAVGDTPELPTVHWPEHDFALLRGTDAYINERSKLVSDVHTKIAPAFNCNSSHIIAAFVRAALLVWSRAFGAVGLVPCVDLINYSSAANAHVVDADDPALDSPPVRVLASRDIAAGEEVFISYANGAGNALLLTRFGFCERDNPNSCVRIGNALLNSVLNDSESDDDNASTCAHNGSNTSAAISHSIGEEQMSYGDMYVAQDGTISEALANAISDAVGMSEPNRKSIEQLSNEGLQALIAVLQARLSSYDGGKSVHDINAAEAEAKRENGGVYVGKAAALLLRGEEKQALERAFMQAVNLLKQRKANG